MFVNHIIFIKLNPLKISRSNRIETELSNKSKRSPRISLEFHSSEQIMSTPLTILAFVQAKIIFLAFRRIFRVY